MNRENCTRLADAIEGRIVPGLAFDMQSYGDRVVDDDDEEGYARGDLSARDRVHPCNSVGCMSGWSAVVSGTVPIAEFAEFACKTNHDFAEDDDRGRDAGSFFNSGDQRLHAIGQQWLELTDEEAYYLFTEYAGASDAECIVVLRHAASTGTLDWRRANSNYGPLTAEVE